MIEFGHNMSKIDFSKVGVVYNSNAATITKSQAVAEYYATARGLNPSFVVGYDFGTSNTVGTNNASRDSFRSGILTTLRDWINTNSLEAVILSIGMPQHYGYKPEYALQQGEYDTKKYSALSQVIAQSPRILNLASDTPSVNPIAVSPKYKNFGGSKDYSIFRPVSNGYNVLDWRICNTYAGIDRVIFGGRLGYATDTPSSDSDTLAYRCIDDAIEFETNGKPKSSPMLFGMSNRTGYIEHGNVYLAYEWAKQFELNNIEIYDGDWGNNAGSMWNSVAVNGYEKPPVTITDQATWLQGGGPVKDIWGWVGTGHEQYQGSNPPISVASYLTSVNFLPGSWMFESTSAGVSKYALTSGACACVVPLQEPYNIGLPEISMFFRALLSGYSIMEAAIMSGSAYSSYVLDIWGDPLYSPFHSFELGNKTSNLGM